MSTMYALPSKTVERIRSALDRGVLPPKKAKEVSVLLELAEFCKFEESRFRSLEGLVYLK